MHAQSIEQQLPTKVADQVVHRRWNVDVTHAARTFGMDPERLFREAQEMSTHFSRWVLTVAVARNLQRCTHCGGMLVFDAGLRCAQCNKAVGRVAPGARPAWFGLVPPIGIDGLPVIQKKLGGKAPALHSLGERAGLGKYLLVPLVASYPPSFPQSPVDVFYLPDFSSLCPADQVSHTFHMLGAGRMCLFASGEWYPQMTAREVLQQRAYPHVIKFLNYANGKGSAFAKVS
jgi:hypothetical protein